MKTNIKSPAGIKGKSSRSVAENFVNIEAARESGELEEEEEEEEEEKNLMRKRILTRKRNWKAILEENQNQDLPGSTES